MDPDLAIDFPRPSKAPSTQHQLVTLLVDFWFDGGDWLPSRLIAALAAALDEIPDDAVAAVEDACDCRAAGFDFFGYVFWLVRVEEVVLQFLHGQVVPIEFARDAVDEDPRFGGIVFGDVRSVDAFQRHGGYE